ncbi:MAG: RluA family pseudouridine synthase [Anaerolineales bacterium]|nr:RluA family pseudouridine synthase [Anaerolineales bacterium]MCS7247388.1 RluA family pseudouridine synthase [Anaerolineales bacterium]MDW8161199.1 RluA family pseudouridine synthase [Anaerolineales bacterium]MDW8448027.1 RluA family pseudouridine synthase [Anaerolineales bacterium]
MGEREIEFTYQESYPKRLDKVLLARFPELSRERWLGLIKDGFVSVNGTVAKKGGQLVQRGDRICARIPPPAPAQLEPEPLPLKILYEDERLLVIDKPAGMVVHPGAGHERGTLVNAVLAYAPEIEGVGGEVRPGVVHRLDKDTSGILLIAKDERSHRWLQEQFRLRKAEKIYLALVDGKPPTPRGRIEAPVGRSAADRKKMAILPPGKGRMAISEYRTLEGFPRHTLLEVHPLTGRTHQIRLHLQFIGCPVVGDRVYGRQRPTLPIERHFLHAHRLSITLPGETHPRTFESPLPEDLAEMLETLRRSGG